MANISQFSIALGTVAQVDRAPLSTITGDLKKFTLEPRGERITTVHQMLEQFMVVLEDGREMSSSIQAEQPFLRSGSSVAITMKSGQPVEIQNLASGEIYWLNGGPEADFPTLEPAEFRLGCGIILGILALSVPFIPDFGGGPVFLLLLALAAGSIYWGIKSKRYNREIRKSAAETRHALSELRSDAIARYQEMRATMT